MILAVYDTGISKYSVHIPVFKRGVLSVCRVWYWAWVWYCLHICRCDVWA